MTRLAALSPAAIHRSVGVSVLIAALLVMSLWFFIKKVYLPVLGHPQPRLRMIFGALTLALVPVWLVAQLSSAIALNFFEFDNEKEPYVYVQTFKDIKKLTEPVLRLAEREATKYDMVGHIMVASNWPLPWVFG